jgi:hypothetical protein
MLTTAKRLFFLAAFTFFTFACNLRDAFIAASFVRC